SNARLRAEDCIIWSNSTDDGALNFSRGESLAKAFCTAGKARHGYGTSKPAPQEKCRKLPDPLAGFHIPNTGPCEHHKKSYKIGKNNHIKPGVYCDGLRIRGKRVTIDPGIYVIRGGALQIEARSQIMAEGVTFLLEENSDGIDIRGAGMTLVAPKTGPTAGLAIAQNGPLIVLDKSASISAKFDLEGVIYLPQHDLSLRQTGGGSQSSPYIQMVVNRLVLRETAKLDILFDPDKTELPVLIKPEQSARLIN
ncbi:MAG: hypothetical protein AAGF20_09290, partial [Pseudomonadota bacterium]